MEEKAKQIAQLLRLLANEQRLLLLCALLRQPYTVGELHGFTPSITASALSQHLGQLKAAGILDCEKQGMYVIYRIQDPRVVALLGAIKACCCEETPAS